MHGMVFGELKRFIDQNLGGSSWQSLLKQLDFRKVYIPIQEYPDEEILALVSAASHKTGITIYELLVAFGKFIAPTLLKSYHRQINPNWTLIDLLEQTESTIHKVVRLRNPGAKPPRLQIKRVDENKLVIIYSSPRKLCGLALGIAQGLAEQFGEQIKISEEHCMLRGNHTCEIEIERVNQSRQAVTFSHLCFSQHHTQILPDKIAVISTHADQAPIIIAGTGPVGIHAAREVLKLAPEQPLIVYGAEPWEAYNRVRLSELLAGEIDWESIVNPLEISSDNQIVMHINTKIVQIDRAQKIITDSHGRQQPYSDLILAIGSLPRTVDLGNRTLLGIHTYRDIDDAQQLMTHVLQSEQTVILGGGILGMEVAFALKAQNAQADVIILHRHERLMNRELGVEASAFLLKQVEAAGIQVIFNTAISTYLGEHELTGIQLKDGFILPCDNLVVCAGIEANTKLAEQAGLDTNKGIVVNDYLQSSDPHIYAIGECIEHRDKTYGLLGPGLEQAQIAVHNILLNDKQAYLGTPRSVRAKIKHLPICVIDQDQDQSLADKKLKTWVFHDDKLGQFRIVYLHQGRVVRVNSIGEWAEFNLVQQAMEEGFNPRWWHRYRFIKTGSFWEKNRQNPLEWSGQSLVCNCSAVCRNEIDQAIASGHKTLTSISEQTGAMQGCGSCKPIVSQLAKLTVSEIVLPPSHKPLMLTSLVVVILTLMLLLPTLSMPQHSSEVGIISTLLFSHFGQQLSGYTILGLLILSLTLVVNKRLQWGRFVSYEYWRVLHVGLILAATLIVLFHSHLTIGINFNFQLMMLFILTLFSGLFISLLVYYEHGFFDFIILKIKRFWLRLHIFIVSVLFVYIAVHITSVYYFSVL